MSTETRDELTIVRHDQTDGMISVYRGERHVGQIYPAIGYKAVSNDPERGSRCCGDEDQAIAFLVSKNKGAE
jgi:hypothetical protein